MTDLEQALCESENESEIYEAACAVLELFKLDDPMVAQDGAFVEALRRLKSAVERYGLPSGS